MHQPLHDEDDGDKGGNTRHVLFDGRPDNLHWIWDIGLLEHINRNPESLAAELESHITAEARAEWVKGSIVDWVLEGHRLAQTAYSDLGSENPASITPAYERQADPVIELQLEKAGVRLAHLLNTALQGSGNDVGPAVPVIPPDSRRQAMSGASAGTKADFSVVILSDTQGCDFGPYVARVVYATKRNWYFAMPNEARAAQKGRVSVVFEILKDGSAPQMKLAAGSGSELLDGAALAAIRTSTPFPPLPKDFTGHHLVLQFTFLYDLG